MSLKAQNSTQAASNLFCSTRCLQQQRHQLQRRLLNHKKKTLIGSTKTKEEEKMSSFIYQKTALLRATKFSQKES
jgi:hypothetical protein